MSLEIIKKEAMRQHNWTQQYADRVAEYYHDFLKLRAQESSYSPPTDVEHR
jgi:hypothetical protein